MKASRQAFESAVINANAHTWCLPSLITLELLDLYRRYLHYLEANVVDCIVQYSGKYQ